MQEAPASSSNTQHIEKYFDLRHAFREVEMRATTHPEYLAAIETDNQLSWETHFQLITTPPKSARSHKRQPKTPTEIHRRIIQYVRHTHVLLAKKNTRELSQVVTALILNIRNLILILRNPLPEINDSVQIEYAATAYLATAYLEKNFKNITTLCPDVDKNNHIKLQQYKTYATHAKGTGYIAFIHTDHYTKFLASRLEESYLFLIKPTMFDEIFHLTEYRPFHLFYNSVYQASLLTNKLDIGGQTTVMVNETIYHFTSLMLPRCFQFHLMREGLYTPDTLQQTLAHGNSQAVPVTQCYLLLVHQFAVIANLYAQEETIETNARRMLMRIYNGIKRIQHDVARYFLKVIHHATYPGIRNECVIKGITLSCDHKISIDDYKLISLIADTPAVCALMLINATHLLAETIQCLQALLMNAPYENILHPMLIDYVEGGPMFLINYKVTYVPSSVEEEDDEATLDLEEDSEPGFYKPIIGAAGIGETSVDITEDDATEERGEEENLELTEEQQAYLIQFMTTSSDS